MFCFGYPETSKTEVCRKPDRGDGYVDEPVSENPAWRSTKGTPSLETVGFTVLADRGLSG